MNLTKREIAVLILISNGITSAEAGERLHISKNTVNMHIAGIYGKLKVHNRVQAVIAAAGKGYDLNIEGEVAQRVGAA